MVGCHVHQEQLVVLAHVGGGYLQDGGCRGGGVGHPAAEGGAVLEVHGVDCQADSGGHTEGPLEIEGEGGGGCIEDHGVGGAKSDSFWVGREVLV